MNFPPRSRPVGFIIETVAADFGMTPEDLTGPVSVEPVRTARGMAVRLIRDCIDCEGYNGGGRNTATNSYIRIGRIFGRDHTTMISLYNNIGRRLRETDHGWLRQRYDRLYQQVRAVIYPQEKHSGGEVDDCETTAGEASSSA